MSSWKAGGQRDEYVALGFWMEGQAWKDRARRLAKSFLQLRAVALEVADAADHDRPDALRRLRNVLTHGRMREM